MSVPQKSNTVFRPLMALIILIVVMFCLAAYLSELGPERSPNKSSGDSVMANLLGASRAVLSQNLYEKADDYFHFGMAHTRKEAMSNDPFKRLHEKLNPHIHAHADGRNVSEIMPWLKFAIEMDPHNVEAYLVTAYWLSHGGQDTQAALSVLRQAVLNNPNDYRILTERAKIYMLLHEEQKAKQSLDAALRVWPSNQDPADEQTKMDLSQILTYRAFIYEMDGDAKGALQQYERSLALFPDQQGLQKRVVALKEGKIDKVWVQDMWKNLFTLQHDDHDHDHDEDHGSIADRH